MSQLTVEGLTSMNALQREQKEANLLKEKAYLEYGILSEKLKEQTVKQVAFHDFLNKHQDQEMLITISLDAKAKTKVEGQPKFDSSDTEIVIHLNSQEVNDAIIGAEDIDSYQKAALFGVGKNDANTPKFLATLKDAIYKLANSRNTTAKNTMVQHQPFAHLKTAWEANRTDITDPKLALEAVLNDLTLIENFKSGQTTSNVSLAERAKELDEREVRLREREAALAAKE